MAAWPPPCGAILNDTTVVMQVRARELIPAQLELDGECWPGYQVAVAEFSSAAEKLMVGWQKHDEKLNEAIKHEAQAPHE